ncbi:MAG: sigma 54-interacting transcriptional regulator [Paraclostridium sp.]
MVNMIKLESIKDDIQNIAEAISSVLGIDVTIVDDNLVRIAGTGTYLEKVGQQLKNYSAFKESLTSKKELIIEDPKNNSICKECHSSKVCKEFAEVCCPIIYDDISYGVIGLIAFTKEQANIINKRKKDLMNFLRKMADLISNKIEAEIKTYEVELEKKKLETLLNNMDKAVVSINRDGNIEKYNLKFKNIFGIKTDIIGMDICDVLKFIKPSYFIEGCSEKSHSFVYKGISKEFKGIYKINPILFNSQLKGYVLDFIDKIEAIKNYNKINSEHKIYLDNIIGTSYSISKVKEESLMAAKTTSTVLITGESGTGKELFARAIHNHSNRYENPFIAVNCAAIPDNLLESELFGYEEGAFTGAKKGGSLGKFELAHKGTIFLDEIGDMSLHLQAKLLRVLQEKEVDKLGSKHNIAIDVRIIAATNKDLEKMVRKGTFREDLYYRLNVIPISLPSLRERKSDISLLIEYMINEYSNKLDKNVLNIDEKTLEYMINYDWPGNIRELQNIIEYSINRCEGNTITLDDVPNRIKYNSTNNNFNLLESNEYEDIITLEELEKREILKAIEKFKDYKKDKELVAKALGISRATLYRKLEKYQIVSK